MIERYQAITEQKNAQSDKYANFNDYIKNDVFYCLSSYLNNYFYKNFHLDTNGTKVSKNDWLNEIVNDKLDYWFEIWVDNCVKLASNKWSFLTIENTDAEFVEFGITTKDYFRLKAIDQLTQIRLCFELKKINDDVVELKKKAYQKLINS